MNLWFVAVWSGIAWFVIGCAFGASRARKRPPERAQCTVMRNRNSLFRCDGRAALLCLDELCAEHCEQLHEGACRAGGRA